MLRVTSQQFDLRLSCPPLSFYSQLQAIKGMNQLSILICFLYYEPEVYFIFCGTAKHVVLSGLGLSPPTFPRMLWEGYGEWVNRDPNILVKIRAQPVWFYLKLNTKQNNYSFKQINTQSTMGAMLK